MPYRVQTLGPLGGLNEDENPHSLRPDELTKAINVARFGNDVGTRPGLVQLGSGEDYENQLAQVASADVPIQGLHEHLEDFNTGRHLLAVANTSSGMRVHFEDADDLGAGPSMTAGVDNVWTFARHRNRTWGAGGAHTSGGTGDDFWYWEGDASTPTAPQVLAITDSGGQRIRPKYVFEYRNYLLINGLRGNTIDDNNAAATRFPTFNSDPTNTANWLDGNTLGFNAFQPGPSFGADFTTGMGEYIDNQGSWLMVLANKGLHAYQLDPTNDFVYQDSVRPGCVSQRAYVFLGTDSGDAIYMSRFGIHSLRQSQAHGTRDAAKFLSWKIRTTFASLNPNRLDKSVGAYNPRTGRVVFAVSTGSNTTHDLLLVLDVKDQTDITSENARWYKWVLTGTTSGGTPLRANDMKFVQDENGNYHLYVATANGWVLRFNEDVFADLSQPYSAELQTRHDPYGTTQQDKTLGDVIVTCAPGGSYKPKYRAVFDYGARVSNPKNINWNAPGGFTLGSGGSLLGGPDLLGPASRVQDVKIYGAGRGRTIAHNISHTGENEPFRVSRIDAGILGGGETAGVADAA